MRHRAPVGGPAAHPAFESSQVRKIGSVRSREDRPEIGFESIVGEFFWNCNELLEGFSLASAAVALQKRGLALDASDLPQISRTNIINLSPTSTVYLHRRCLTFDFFLHREIAKKLISSFRSLSCSTLLERDQGSFLASIRLNPAELCHQSNTASFEIWQSLLAPRKKVQM